VLRERGWGSVLVYFQYSRKRGFAKSKFQPPYSALTQFTREGMNGERMKIDAAAVFEHR